MHVTSNPLRAPLGTMPLVIALAAVPAIGSLAAARWPIALDTLIGAVALAAALWQLGGQIRLNDRDRIAMLILLLPALLLHGLVSPGALLTTVPAIVALGAALERRHQAMMLWTGIAIGLGMQAALLAPMILALMINRHVPHRLWLIVPVAAAVTWLAGAPAASPGVLQQAVTGNVLAINAPNIWIVLQEFAPALPLLGLSLAATIGAAATFTAHFSARPLGDRTLFSAALLCCLIGAGLLPLMQADAFLLADILAVVAALQFRDTAGWRTCLLIQTASALALASQASGAPVLAIIGAGAMICATAAAACRLFRPAANDNRPVAWTIHSSCVTITP